MKRFLLFLYILFGCEFYLNFHLPPIFLVVSFVLFNSLYIVHWNCFAIAHKKKIQLTYCVCVYCLFSFQITVIVQKMNAKQNLFDSFSMNKKNLKEDATLCFSFFLFHFILYNFKSSTLWVKNYGECRWTFEKEKKN